MKKAPAQRIVENLGLARLHSVVTQVGYIWRPTSSDDYGIDGEIEIVEDNVPTARILKVQLKSGRSYFGRRVCIHGA